MKRWLSFAAALPFAMVTAGSPQEPSRPPSEPGTVRKAIRIPGSGTLLFPIPDGWKVISATALPGDPIVVQLGPPQKTAPPFAIQIRFQTSADAEISSLKTLRKSVKGVRDVMAVSATKHDLPMQDLRGAALRGYYFSATDRRSAPAGGWRYMTYGSALLDDLVLTFSVYSNRSGDDQVGATLELMKRMEHQPPTPEEAAITDARTAAETARWATIEIGRDFRSLPLAIALPDKGWGLWIDLPGYESQGEEVAADLSSARMSASEARTRVQVSAYLERQKKQRTVAGCRSHFTDRMASAFTKREEEREGIILVRYGVPAAGGAMVRDQHTHALFSRDGTCIDVDISKEEYRAEDERLFDAVLSAIKFVKKQQVPVPGGP
jgi:hypothetical protein